MILSLISGLIYQVFRLPADIFGRTKSGSFARRLRRLSDCCESDLDADSFSRIHIFFRFTDFALWIRSSDMSAFRHTNQVSNDLECRHLLYLDLPLSDEEWVCLSAQQVAIHSISLAVMLAYHKLQKPILLSLKNNKIFFFYFKIILPIIFQCFSLSNDTCYFSR